MNSGLQSRCLADGSWRYSKKRHINKGNLMPSVSLILIMHGIGWIRLHADLVRTIWDIVCRQWDWYIYRTFVPAIGRALNIFCFIFMMRVSLLVVAFSTIQECFVLWFSSQVYHVIWRNGPYQLHYYVTQEFLQWKCLVLWFSWLLRGVEDFWLKCHATVQSGRWVWEHEIFPVMILCRMLWIVMICKYNFALLHQMA